jgi:outer membrane lipoprotein-sorting protein
MANHNDVNNDALLQRVIRHIQGQEIPDFPDPQITIPQNTPSRVPSIRFISTLRRTVMNRRFQVSVGAVVGLAAVLGFLMLWSGGAAQSVSAMEKMAESIRKAKSFKVSLVIEDNRLKSGKPTIKRKATGEIYWLAPGTSRIDLKGLNIAREGEFDETQFYFTDRTLLIEIDHKTKKYKRSDCTYQSGITEIAQLSEFSGKPNRDLGIKKIDGKEARGFEISADRLWPDQHINPASGSTVQVWVDSESSLPLLVEFNWDDSFARLQDFQWNIDLDPKVFDLTVPKGYSNVTTSKFPTSSGKERADWYAKTLKLYPELTGGHNYPQTITYLKTKALKKDLYKAFGFEYYEFVMPPKPGREQEQYEKWKKQNELLVNNETWKKTNEVILVFHQIANDLILNSDAAYYGKTVKPGDKEKVLLRWKLDDGHYEVIYGDLRIETVTAERLRTLEGKEK